MNKNNFLKATIWRMDLDGKNKTIIASGVRNTVGFDFDPETGDLWFTENGRDMMGDDTPPDELNHMTSEGVHYGFPFCHGKGIPDPQFNPSKNCTIYKPATYELGPHVAALGLTFYEGSKFPKKYQKQPFFAEHGSWNRRVPIGYRVMWVNKNDPSKESYQVFVDGWLQLPENLKEIQPEDSRFAWVCF
jgi:glucose/arabinose dehydrogenase